MFENLFFVFLFLFFVRIGVSIIIYGVYKKGEFESSVSQQIDLWNSRKMAGGHGVVYDRENKAVINDIDEKDCEDKINYLKENKEKIIKSLKLKFLSEELFKSLFIAFGFTVFLMFIL